GGVRGRSAVGGGEGRQGRGEGQPDVRFEVGDRVARPGGGAVVRDAVEREVDGVRERRLTQLRRLPCLGVGTLPCQRAVDRRAPLGSEVDRCGGQGQRPATGGGDGDPGG